MERFNNTYFTHEEFKIILKHYGEIIRDTAPWNSYEEKIPYECYRRLMKECVKGVRLIAAIDGKYYFFDDDKDKYQEAKEYFAESPHGAKAVRIVTTPTEPLIMVMEPEHDFCQFLRDYYLLYRPEWHAPPKEEKEEDKDMRMNSNATECTLTWNNDTSTSRSSSSSSLTYDGNANGEYDCVWTTTSAPAKIVDWSNVKDSYTFTIDNVDIAQTLKELAGVAQSTGQAIGNLGNEINKINDKNEKENEEMKGLNFDFGPCTNDNVRMSMYGIAVKNANSEWVSYNPSTGEIINVDVFNFDGRKYMFKMPVAIKDVAVGDVVVHQKKAMFVLEVCGDESGLVVVDVAAGEEKKIVPTSNMFGFNFITKIVSMFSMFASAPTPDAPFGNFLPFVMMGEDGKMGDIDPMMMMFLMSNGKMGDMFSNPMMMYFLMKDGGNDSMLPFMMMMNQNQTHSCKCGK